MLKRKPMAAAAAEEEEAAAAPAAAPAAAEPAAEPAQSEFVSFPANFGGRGQRAKTETLEVAGPQRPVYSAPNKPDDYDAAAAWMPKEKKQKRVSLYANQNGGIANPKKGKRKRMGAPHGPQF